MLKVSKYFKNVKFREFSSRFNKDIDPELLRVLKEPAKTHIEFYKSIFGLNSQKTVNILKKNLPLCKADLNDVRETADYLNENQYSIDEILERPSVLLTNKLTIENRTKVLQECKFRDVRLLFLSRYVFLMNKKVNMLKAYDYIDYKENVSENLQKLLQLNVTLRDDLGENIPLNNLRINVLNLYLKEHLNCNNQTITKLWKTYFRVKHRSFDSILKTVDVLKNHLHFTNERIINNGYLLYADPDNILDILNNIPTVAGHDIREILMRRPKIMMSNWESIQKIITHITQAGIPEKTISKCLEVLTLSPETVKERLIDVQKIDEFNVLCNHPRILRLVHYQNKALTRLNYLQQLKVKCISLNVLSSSSDTFEKYAREGVDKTKGKDVVLYLAKVFKQDEILVRNSLSRHPNWCHVPILSVKASLDYLKYKKFTNDEIFQNIHLLLYPISRIEDKLNALVEWKTENNNNAKISGVSLSSISNSKLLGLCLYFIEVEFHFTGDGIWSDNIMHIHDNFPTTLPEFPKTLVKTYKYGVKPPDAVDQNQKPANLC